MFDHLSGGEKSILIGHDWGGAVAWSFAMAHPQYLERLVIINAPHPLVFLRQFVENPEQRKASAYMNMFRRPEAEQALSANDYQVLCDAVFAGSARPDVYTEEEKKAYIEAWSQPGALTGGLNYYRALPAGPPRDEEQAAATASVLEQLASSGSYVVRVPTLVIWGMKDIALTAANLEGLDEYVPDLRIKRIPDGTHWVISEQPDVVNAEIRAFL
jgi:pimeloyl-ACP methyl ester carboxylesterase